MVGLQNSLDHPRTWIRGGRITPIEKPEQTLLQFHHLQNPLEIHAAAGPSRPTFGLDSLLSISIAPSPASPERTLLQCLYLYCQVGLEWFRPTEYY